MLLPRLDKIDSDEVLLYLGGAGKSAPPGLAAEIRACGLEIMDAARPRLTYRIFPLEDGALRGAEFPLVGRDIRRHLQDCTHAVLMAATLGPDVETLLMRTQVTDMARALILDSCASTAIENVCDNFEGELRAQYEARGQFLTDRFSPGYGDMPIEQQRDFCDLLDTRRRIGLTVSQSGIMLPRKSVTAVLGVSDTPRTRRSAGCANCSMFENCSLRKSGAHCGT
ncbi:MAG: vitamin B12 dependent methionine synthase, activation domain protein [Oscillospiraceae bacterium]|nr:vitamin B12 dependent methionine synthase, activation domain protein [Oscillospiraceae bacterium]